MKIALCLIVKPSDEEAQQLKNCLNSVADNVDGIFITQAGVFPNSEVSKVIEYFGGVESFYKWDNNFANARNYNFSQVPADYDFILWLDADDVLENGHKLKDTIAQKDADAYSLWYLYAFDEHNNPVVVHRKTQIVKNNGSVEWVGAIHEDFKQNRELNLQHIDGITRIHNSNDERFDTNKKRNLEIAKEELSKKPNDPRSYWNVANAYKACGENNNAIESFNYFIDRSGSDDERYLAYIRQAEAYWEEGAKQKAIDKARLAVGQKPTYPDAYILLGQMLYHLGNYQEAVEILKTSLYQNPPYYNLIAYNPRDYDYTPLKWLAYCYLQIHQPMLAYECFKAMLEINPEDKNLAKVVEQMKKEADKSEKIHKKYSKLADIKDKKKLKEELDKVPEDFKYHPLICNLRNKNFIKKTSTGNEVVIFCGYTAKEWTSKTAQESGIGGSEEAVIHLSERLVKKGYDVTVYNNCGHKEQVINGVKYRPFMAYNYRDRVDVTILWRHPKIADFAPNTGRLFLDLHDMLDPGELTKERLAKIDKIFVKSQFHRDVFASIPDEKFVIVPNGIESERFKGEHKKDYDLMINTSSPDRSLDVLIDMFANVKKRCPRAKLKWAYGWETFDVVHSSNPQMMAWKEHIQQKIKDTDGFEELGMIPSSEVEKLYKEARIFAYPSEFAEIDCISLTKAMAAGAIPFTTNFAAMGDKRKYGGVFIESDKTLDNWSDRISFGLEDKDKQKQWEHMIVSELRQSWKEPTRMREEVQKDFDWNKIVDIWIENFK